MNRLAQITALSAQIDSTLNEFALAANAQGEYPWQTAQRERRNRRVAGAAVGTAAIGAGAYGVKKGMDALNKRYGTAGADGLKTGAADLVNRADDAVKAGVQKVKTGARRVQNYGKNVAGKFKSLRSGASAGLGLGRRGALMGALKSVKFSRADQIIALERKLDGALAEFGLGTTGALIGGTLAAAKRKEGETTPEYLGRTAKGAIKGAVVGTVAGVGAHIGMAALQRNRRAQQMMRQGAAIRRARRFAGIRPVKV